MDSDTWVLQSCSRVKQLAARIREGSAAEAGRVTAAHLGGRTQETVNGGKRWRGHQHGDFDGDADTLGR